MKGRRTARSSCEDEHSEGRGLQLQTEEEREERERERTTAYDHTRIDTGHLESSTSLPDARGAVRERGVLKRRVHVLLHPPQQLLVPLLDGLGGRLGPDVAVGECGLDDGDGDGGGDVADGLAGRLVCRGGW